MRKIALCLSLLVVGCDSDVVVDAGVDAGVRRDAGPRDAGPPPDDSPYKGPWVQRPTADAITVRWESRLAPPTVAVEVTPLAGGDPLPFTGTSRETMTRLSYGIDNALVREADVPGTYYVNEVELSGLAPAQCYTYTIVGWPTDGGRFCTMHAADDTSTPIRFYVIGDTSPAFMGTLRLISAAQPEDTEFTVHVGDIQYYSTLIESQQVWFTLMQPLLRANAFLPCVGNHEVDEIEFEYVDYYQRLFTPAGRNGNDRWYHYQTGGVWFFSLSTEHDLDPGSEQADWLEEELTLAEADPSYRFSIVYLHRPLYTLGDYRPNEQQRMVLFDVLAAHRVPLVLAGHVHGYERFEYPDTTHVVSGAGGFTDPSVDQHLADYPDDAMHRVASGVFLQSMIFEIVRDAMGRDVIHGEALDDMGIVRDSFERVVSP
ncbi:MAG: metallophosphoesterase [Sandaracinaceae bacterium]